MTEDEAREIMKSLGWTWHIRTRNRITPYIYAMRREGKKVKDRYVAPLSKLPELTETDLVAKLTNAETTED
jgi:dihydrodipicolinate synthase/N-acetylneuraminate lyase